MSRRTRLLALASVIAVVPVIGFSSSVGTSRRVVTYSVGTDHVRCATNFGLVKFVPALHTSGSTTGSENVGIKGTLLGCTDLDNAAVHMFGGSFQGVVSNNGGTSCNSMEDTDSETGLVRFTWKPATGQAFFPTVLVGNAQKPVTDVTISQIVAGTSTLLPGQQQFELGAPDAAPLSATTDFTGGDSGASSAIEMLMSQSTSVVAERVLEQRGPEDPEHRLRQHVVRLSRSSQPPPSARSVLT